MKVERGETEKALVKNNIFLVKGGKNYDIRVRLSVPEICKSFCPIT